MLVKIFYDRYDNSYEMIDVTDICPSCGKGMEANVRGHDFFKDSKRYILYITLQCPICKDSWTDSYNYDRYHSRVTNRKVNYYQEIPSELSKEINELSPQGCKTYLQAMEAETKGLDTLVGIGLRKSLEFILKDFLIATKPDKKENIKKEFLNTVIQNYIDEPSLTILAQATAWLGNDETHYVKRNSDKDLQDLKKFLHATIRFIEYKLTISEADDFVNR